MMRDCNKCNGCGCPACLGFGWDCKKFVKDYGKRFLDIKNLTPEEVPSLPVTEQRKIHKWCLSWKENIQTDLLEI